MSDERRWRDLTPDQAAGHGLFGLGGGVFLFLVFAGTVLGFTAGAVNSPRIGNAAAVVLALNFIPAAVLFALGVSKSRHFPYVARSALFALSAALGASAVAAAILDPLAFVGFATATADTFGVARDVALRLDPRDLKSCIIGAAAAGSIGAALFAIYMRRSRRVNVTFRHRVRPEDPILATLASKPLGNG